MLYNNRSYPHPVLGIGDDYVGEPLEVELRVSSSDEQIEIVPSFKVVNTDLQHLIEKKKAILVTHIYCRGTMFRDVFKSEKTVADGVKIDSNKLNGEVEIDFFICANERIDRYLSSEFNTDFSGYSFSVDKGDILAYGGKGKFFANKSPEELKSISALMNISTTGKENHPMKLDYSGEKITLLLSQEEYDNYQMVKGNDLSVNILLSCIVLPALIEALHFLADENAKDFADRRWFTVLSDISEKSKDGTELELAQRILQLPNNRSFNTVIQLLESV